MSGTPTFYLVDHRGVIRHKWVGAPGAKALDAAIEELLQEVERSARKEQLESKDQHGPASRVIQRSSRTGNRAA